MEEDSKKLKAGCFACRVTYENAAELLDHMLETGHCLPKEFSKDAADHPGLLKELADMIEAIQYHKEGTPVPSGWEVEELDMDDPELPPEVAALLQEEGFLPQLGAPEARPGHTCPVCHASLSLAFPFGPRPAPGESKGQLHVCHYCASLLLAESPTRSVPCPQEILDDPEIQAIYKEALAFNAKIKSPKVVRP